MPIPDEQRPKDKGAQNDAYFDTIWNDQMYLDAIKPYENESWYNQLMDNPFLRSKQARFATDPLTEMFNYQGAAAAYYGGMRTDAMSWLDRKVQEMRQQDYNSAPEQVKRNAQAGINSDLAGNVSPGDAAENDSPLEPSFANGTSDSGMQIAQAGLSFISNIISFGTQIQQLNIGATNLVKNELENNQSAFDFGVNAVAGLSDLRERYEKEPEVFNDDPSFVGILQESLKKANHKFTQGFSRKTRKLVNAWFDRLDKGDPLAIQAVRSKLRKDVLQNNKESAQIMSDPWYSDDFNEWIGNIGEHFSKYVAQINEWSARMSAANSRAEGKFAESNEENYRGVLGSEFGVRAKTAESAKAYQEYQGIMNKLWDDILKSCQPEDGGKRKWYHTLGSILVMFFRTQLSQPLHLGIGSTQSSSQMFNPKTGASSTSQSSGTTWHF